MPERPASWEALIAGQVMPAVRALLKEGGDTHREVPPFMVARRGDIVFVRGQLSTGSISWVEALIMALRSSGACRGYAIHLHARQVMGPPPERVSVNQLVLVWRAIDTSSLSAMRAEGSAFARLYGAATQFEVFLRRAN